MEVIFRSSFLSQKSYPEVTLDKMIDSMISGDWGKETPQNDRAVRMRCVRGTDIPSIDSGGVGKAPLRYILEKNYEKKKLLAGDIIVEVSGGGPTQSTGRAALVSSSMLGRHSYPLCCTNFCKAIRPKEEYSLYLSQYWKYMYKRGIMFSYENGTTGIKNLDLKG
ncbi:restriction endonuclease subunit S [Eggerthella lenta]|uniref:Restriction endonuclease subunit S n=1 Tax=Eggerthella lenta TaxID=84112 RepID=A0A5C5BPH1_EGGLN|nr:restriction endonuclease subunit S [Eggerthella lenta]TNU87905.1 restriction endonuclease subunit S [Eggerthella lenta]